MSKWPMARLGDIGEIITGTTPPTSNDIYYSSNDVCFIKPNDFSGDRVNHVNNSVAYISDEARQVARIVPKGAVFTTCIGIIGKVGIAECEAAFNQQINAIIPDNKVCISSYLAYSIFFKKKELNAIANAPVVPIINKTQFSQIKIPLPSLDEQKRIASVLDKAQSLIDLRKKQIADMDALAQSVFLDMFGDPVKNEKGWEKKELSSYIEFLTSGSRGWATYYSDSGAFFITIKNVKNGKILRESVQYVNPPNTQEAIRTKVKANDILISITADLGRTAVIDAKTAEENAYINQHLALVRLNKSINPVYLTSFLESPAGKAQFNAKNQVGVKSGLNFEAIKSLLCLIPPHTMQEEYAKKINHIESNRQNMQQGLALLEQNYNALIQQYFY